MGVVDIRVTATNADQPASTYVLTLTGDFAPPIPNGLAGYRVYRSTTPNAWMTGDRIAQLEPETFSFVDDEPLAGTSFYQVTALFDGALGEPGNNEVPPLTEQTITSSGDNTMEMISPATFDVERLSREAVSVYWVGLSNFVYTVQFREDLAQGAWRDVEEVTGQSGFVSRDYLVSSETGFYRLSVRVRDEDP